MQVYASLCKFYASFIASFLYLIDCKFMQVCASLCKFYASLFASFYTSLIASFYKFYGLQVLLLLFLSKLHLANDYC